MNKKKEKKINLFDCSFSWKEKENDKRKIC